LSVPYLDIPVRPSRIYAGALLLLYGVTWILLSLVPVVLPLRLLLLLVFFGLCWRTWREWRRLQSIQRLQVLPDGYRLITSQGELDLVEGQHTRLTRWLVILHLRAAKRVFHLPLLPDTASAEDLRRLRVWLRCS
jgi:hypothetical protein